MAEFASMPFFTDAWIADTRHLSRLERGTYFDFLVLIWRSPNCKVPNDAAWLAKHMALTKTEIEQEVRPLIKEFCKCDGNWITDERLTKQYEYVQRKRQKNTDAANYRWTKEKAQCERNATSLSSSLSSSDPERDNLSLKDSDHTYVRPDGQTHDDWPENYKKQFWEAYPRKQKKLAALKQLETVRKLHQVPWQKLMTAVAHIDTSEPQFIPLPTRWLEGERWDDEIVNANYRRPVSSRL